MSAYRLSTAWFLNHLVLVWAHSKVLNGLSGVLWSSEQKSVASSRSSQRQLIQSQDFTSSSNDAGACGGGEPESSNADLRNSEKTVIIGNGANDDDGLVVRLLRCVRYNSGERNWRAVHTGHEQSSENDLVEGSISSACKVISVKCRTHIRIDSRTRKEAVKLH